MELTLDEVLRGKACNIKGKEYRSAEAYITPFLERMNEYTDDFKVQVKTPTSLSVDKDNGEDTWYSRVWVQAVLPGEYAYDNHVQSVSLLYALDTRKPIVKIFKNTVNMACLNMCVFSPEHIEIQELNPETSINYKFVTEVMKKADFTRKALETLANREYKRDEIYANLGEWVDRCITTKYDNGYGIVKLKKDLPVSAYENLFYNEKSDYFTKGNSVDGFTVYNSFTDLISNDGGKDIVNKFEKTYLVSKVLNI